MPAAQVSVVGHCHAVWGGLQVVREGNLQSGWVGTVPYLLLDSWAGVARALGGESSGHPLTECVSRMELSH